MRPPVTAFIALALASTAGEAVAQVAQNFSYDGHGRLTGVSTTGAGGSNMAVYAYDNADNRTNRSQTGTAAYAALSRLPVDDGLQPDQALVSPNGRFSLAVRGSGALELWSEGEVVGSNLSDAPDPVFIIDDAKFARFRGAELPDARQVGAWLALGDEGELTLFDSAGSTLLWRSSLTVGTKVSR